VGYHISKLFFPGRSMTTPPTPTALWTLLLATCLPASPLFGQDLRFERLDGLSHNTVTSIVQDREGFLWVGTSDGLNRYDGYDFVVYRHDRFDATSLSNNSIKVLLEDRAGALWVGTDGGLDRFDRRTGRFIRHSLRPDTPASHSQAILAMLEDHEGRLWVGTNDGLYRYDLEAARFTAYRHEPDNPHSLAGDRVWSLYERRDRTLWVSTLQRNTGEGSTLHRYDPQADHFARFPLPPAWAHTAIRYEDEAGRLWLSDQHTRIGAFLHEGGRLDEFPDVPADQAVRAVLDDRRGIRWIGTPDGLYRHDPSTRTHRPVRIDPSPGAYLQNNVWTLYEDRTGILWVGTLSGLYRLDPHTKPFHHLGHDPTDANSLTNNTVMAVREDADGHLWVGTLGGGLNRLDRATGTVTRYRHRAGRPTSLCHDRIWSLYEDRRGTLWIGTDEGLCGLDRRTGRFTRYALPLDAPAAKQPPINALREDPAGRLWIATNVGLYRFDPLTGAARRYARPDDAPVNLASNFFVQSLYLDRSGRLWLGVFGGMLYRFDAEAETFTRYPLWFTDREELVSEGIWAIHEDRDGLLWLGSDLGLTRVDPRSGAVKHFTERDGLPGSIVYAILQDDILGHLWLSTNNGLARFDDRLPPARRIRVYDAGDGLRNTEFNRRAAFKGKDGTFFFGGLEGLTRFHPTTIHDNRAVPPVVLTRIETSNRDTTVAVNPYGLERLVLSYRDYTVAFAFTALNFTNPAQNQYAYQLEGFDEQWIEAGPRRFASYTNIPPGAYTFRVKGSNDDGVWNEQGAALAVLVTPPFWQTWWFRLLIAGLVAAGLLAAHRYRVARLLEVERMRLRIASDLHDDIGSNLSSIALLSDIVQGRERLGDRERRHLSRISRSARAMVDALRDIVWSIDPDSDRPGDLVRRMQDTAASLLGNTRWSLHTPSHGLAAGLDMDVRRHVFLGYKEMLHNIARHADATEVTIRIEEDRDALRLTVSDDGVGFDAAAPAGNGLKSLRERAARIGGTLDVVSRPGGGTTIRLVAPRAGDRRKTA